MKRNDSLWHRLIAASKINSFNIKNTWSLFATQGDNILENKNKLLRDKVDFDATIFNKFIEGQNHQVLKGCTRGGIGRVNCLPVLLMGSQIDIVDHVCLFAWKTFT